MKPKLYIVALLVLFSCRKLTNGVETGNYKGKFIATYPNTNYTLSGSTILELKRKTYTCTGNESRAPAGGSGRYEIEKDYIEFFDENLWTDDFDHSLILNGKYEYNAKGKTLILIKKDSYGRVYQYNLSRQ